MAENKFIQGLHEEGLIDEREVVFMADIASTNGNKGRGFVLLNGRTLSIYEMLSYDKLGDPVDCIDLTQTEVIKASSFVLHTSMKLKFNNIVYSFQGFTQAKRIIEAIKESCGN